jgi:hypothetical protein
MLPLLFAATTGMAQDPGPPSRTVPPAVLVQLAAVEDRFELALAADCAPGVCFSKGCTYVAHTVADRPPAASLPGLGGEPGPSPVEAQSWLTQARCEFAYEDTVEPGDVQALARRLQTKVSSGFAVVSVGSQQLPPLPSTLHEEAPVAEPPVAPPPPPPPPSPVRELWASLLDDFPWMIALVLGTTAATSLIWAWRRVGRETFEERALLAEMARGEGEAEDAPAAPEPDPVAGNLASWRIRLQAGQPDAEVQAMLRDLLRAGELPLLAKAVLTFPETLPRMFPSGGDIGGPKLALSEYLKTADPAALPSDAELFRALDRRLSSATLAAQGDAEVVRLLREEFGASGLLGLIEGVPARAGALLFAHAPLEARNELVHLLTSARAASLAEQLLASNRMDPSEAAYLADVVRAAASHQPLPPAPEEVEVSDRGVVFDAAGALSTLLPWVRPADRSALLAAALDRFGGNLPAWYTEILIAEMLLSLADEDRADVLLGVEATALAGWLSLQDPPLAERLLDGAPNALRLSVSAASAFPSRAKQVAEADRGRRLLARAFQDQTARRRVPFEQVIRNLTATP